MSNTVNDATRSVQATGIQFVNRSGPSWHWLLPADKQSGRNYFGLWRNNATFSGRSFLCRHVYKPILSREKNLTGFTHSSKRFPINSSLKETGWHMCKQTSIFFFFCYVPGSVREKKNHVPSRVSWSNIRFINFSGFFRERPIWPWPDIQNVFLKSIEEQAFERITWSHRQMNVFRFMSRLLGRRWRLWRQRRRVHIC